MKRTITLSHDLANELVCYLLMTTNYRKGERESWEKLATETNPDGTMKFPNAPSNARYWAELDNKLDEIRQIIDESPLSED